MADRSVASRSGLDELINSFERFLPDALPRRDGLWEPPQHVYATTGREHLTGFIEQHSGETKVWCPTRRMIDFSLTCPEIVGFEYRGFRTARMSLSIEIGALRQAGWDAALRHIWRKLSLQVRPFYGEVCTLQGYKRSRNGAIILTRLTEGNPVKV